MCAIIMKSMFIEAIANGVINCYSINFFASFVAVVLLQLHGKNFSSVIAVLL